MTSETHDSSCGDGCGCRRRLFNRRDILIGSGAALLGGVLSAMPVMAGPLNAEEAPGFAALIPPDKKLQPAWVRSLFARGRQTTYTKKRDELRYIGMPVGGICCGTVYLGGDGRLWVWDIFNENREGILPRSVTWDGFGGKQTVAPRDGAAYVAPHTEQAPLEQGFAIRVNGVTRALDAAGWRDVAFTGQYPIGMVQYDDPQWPVSVTLTAYSPFIPLNAGDSGLPAILCEMTLRNTGSDAVEAEVAGWLQNAVRLDPGTAPVRLRYNTEQPVPGASVIACTYGAAALRQRPHPRPNLPVADFQQATYAPWVTTGTAFGTGPVRRADAPSYQGDLGGLGDRVVNSHASAPGTDSDSRDSAVGTLTSPPFTIARDYLTFYIGGGSDIDQVGLAVLVDGKTVARAAGSDDNQMRRAEIDLSAYHGKKAVIQIYDHGTGAWGNVGVSLIVQTDAALPIPLDSDAGNAGTMALMLLGGGTVKADADPVSVFDAPASAAASVGAESKLIGAITTPLRLAPGESRTVTFGIAWHFPNSKLNVKDAATGNYYVNRFSDAVAVAAYLARDYPRLSHATKLWRETWYDSTLPFWFLERTFTNISLLATSTAHRFGTGRFWGWEGVGCCEGTCTHVWHYAQAVGRIFPELERYVREHVDLGVALDLHTGQIGFRGEGTGPAVDGQCGRILGTYREHQMSADDGFLRRVWPHLKLAMGYMIHHDSNNDGLIDGPQENTLDGTWYGKIPWISSLYAAALRACEEMATEMGDTEFAAECHARFLTSKSAIETQLFDGEYFVQLPDPAHADSLGAYRGCHIDQVQGQSWAWQVNLGRVLDPAMTVSALQSLYKYNFAPDVGRFRAQNTEGRPYALAGDAGLIMVTNPHGLPNPFGVHSWQFGYFNECMTGFEHQAASHMIAEGMVLEGLAVTRAIHDRYHASRRNPYNEIECSDHYARSMASYGSFLSCCGFAYHGPKGEIAFDPRITPEDFRAPFTAAEGWGTYAQKMDGKQFYATLTVHYGRLRLTKITLRPPASAGSVAVTVEFAGQTLPVISARTADGRLEINLARPALILAGKELRTRSFSFTEWP